MNKSTSILFVDDQWCRPESRSVLISEYGSLLEDDVDCYTFYYETAENGSGGYSVEPVLDRVKQILDLKAVILDIMFGSHGDRLGLDILSAIRDQYPTLPVFMMTSLDDDIDVIERAMEFGANEYLVKKPTLNALETILKIYTRPTGSEADYAIWGNSSAIRRVRAVIARVAVSASASVLICGESGTGKELVARAIHRQGSRRNRNLIDKNCAEDKSGLLDSDLFGHEKGAFTGADRRHTGRLEQADGGVLFLDEISSMPIELQGKLLRVLETHAFQRLGGSKTIKSDFQLICATNEDPQQLIDSGRLRKDFFYRISQLEIHVPPLEDRREDIPILAEYFLKRFKGTVGASYKGERFTPDALNALASGSWRGNARELRNLVERTVILSRGEEIRRADLGLNKNKTDSVNAKKRRSNTAENLPDDMGKWARSFCLLQLNIIAEALESTGGNVTLAMKHLFPLINNPNATYLKRYVKRLQEAPWGYDFGNDDELLALVEQISGNSMKRS